MKVASTAYFLLILGVGTRTASASYNFTRFNHSKEPTARRLTTNNNDDNPKTESASDTQRDPPPLLTTPSSVVVESPTPPSPPSLPPTHGLERIRTRKQPSTIAKDEIEIEQQNEDAQDPKVR